MVGTVAPPSAPFVTVESERCPLIMAHALLKKYCAKPMSPAEHVVFLLVILVIIHNNILVNVRRGFVSVPAYPV